MARTLLIADDDPHIRSLARECLASWVTICTEAEDGETAIVMAAEQKPDILLLDMMMPGMSGFDVCHELKSNPATRRIPIIFVTSNSLAQDKIRGIDLGASDYITKPYHPGELQSRVKSVLRFKDQLESVERLVARDRVTGLFNRAYLEQRLEADLAASRRQGRPLACCLASVKGLSRIASVPGTAESEVRMRDAANGLLSVLRREDVACRHDQETFAVLGFVANQTGAIDLALRVQRAISSALKLPPNTAEAVVSVGVALSRYSIGDSLIWHANEALRHARNEAPGTVQFGGELLELELVDRTVN